VRRTDTVVIGAGQAGLSLSRQLVRAGHRHVVLERGRVGERWRSERWHSLTLLTPNWLNRLEGSTPHPDPDGYLARDEFVKYLQNYARSVHAPVRESVSVLAVEQHRGGFSVRSDAGEWQAGSVVIATGDCDVPFRPQAAATAPSHLLQIDANRYRAASQLPAGGVLVVGAGPSGQQIAAELRRAGRHVVLAVGRHARMVRHYRGKDIWHWLEEMGDLERTIDDVPNPVDARRAPSFPLSGRNGGEQLDLGVLHRLGVVVTGRLEGFGGARALFADDLQTSIADAERRLHRILGRIDEHIAHALAPASVPAAPDRSERVRIHEAPRTLDLAAESISTVVWATGYRRTYPWLHVPVLDQAGEIVHRRGIAAVPGVYVLGLRFQYRRSSHFIGGVGRDAAFLATHIVGSTSPTGPRRSQRSRPYAAATAARVAG
jgi:putative flavoprotein involved in K+ transport